MPEILHEIPIAADAKKVYEALTDQAGLAAWWTPQVVATPALGSIAEFVFPGIVLKMEVSALEPERRVEWKVEEAVPEWDNTVVAWDLKPARNGTTLLFGHRNFASSGGMFARYSISWAWHIMSLKDYLETGKGRPGPTPF